MLYATLIVCTYLFLKFIEPILSMILNLIQLKLVDIGTNYQLNSQSKVCLHLRDFPEMNQCHPTVTDAIGFKFTPSDNEDDEEYYDDCKNKIGFLIQK